MISIRTGQDITVHNITVLNSIEIIFLSFVGVRPKTTQVPLLKLWPPPPAPNDMNHTCEPYQYIDQQVQRAVSCLQQV